MEGGMRFEEGLSGESPELPENPNEGLRFLVRSELETLSWEAADEFTREVALKGLAKIHLKDEVDEMQRYKDDIQVRQKMKRLGALVVVENTSRFTFEDKDSDFAIEEGDPYIDIHIPPLEGEEKSLTYIGNSFKMLAEYIKEHDIPGEYVIGITYEKLAKVSRRYGFQLRELNLPSELTRGVERVHERFRGAYGFDIGKILMCIQSKDQLLEKFSE